VDVFFSEAGFRGFAGDFGEKRVAERGFLMVSLCGIVVNCGSLMVLFWVRKICHEIRIYFCWFPFWEWSEEWMAQFVLRGRAVG
jgi:hypothetical protein